MLGKGTFLFHYVVEEKPERNNLIPSSYKEINGKVTQRDFVQDSPPLQPGDR